MKPITASKLYDYIQCPHKVWRDLYGPQGEKIQESNPFVEMLWEKGVAHEEKIVSGLGEYVDLGDGTLAERFQKTMDALKAGAPLIFQGVLRHGNDLGIPDLLKKMPDGKYVPVDIKSGVGFEGTPDGDDEENGKPKKHYAVQLCHYVSLLQNLGIPNTGRGKIIDIRGDEVEYDFEKPMGKKTPMTLWEFYEKTKGNVEILMSNQDQNKPAMAGSCKLCPWYKSCKKWCEQSEDLSNIFSLGRSKRDIINEDLGVCKVGEMCEVDMVDVLEIKKKNKLFLKGVGEKTLEKIISRAKIFHNKKDPVLYRKFDLPKVSYELFFDIEDDPTQEFVYMHGVYERKGDEVRFVHFTAKDKTEEAEKEAFANFWKYVRSLPEGDFAAYYYSPHEKTTYRKMQKLYPDAVSAEEVESFFANPNVIDLYNDVILKYSDWPLGSYSLKEIAQYLGFRWRDETPSGALSIQWFNEYLKNKDEKILERILEYNEDDCKATMVIKDAIEKISVKNRVI